MGKLLCSLVVLCASLQATAAEITPGNLVGRYTVEARVAFRKFYANVRILPNNEVELQRTYPDGAKDELCNGTYTLNSNFYLMEYDVLAAGKEFRGTFTCPSNRSKTMTFNIDFENKKMEDLQRGAQVSVTSSMAPGMTAKAYLKKR